MGTAGRIERVTGEKQTCAETGSSCSLLQETRGYGLCACVGGGSGDGQSEPLGDLGRIAGFNCIEARSVVLTICL